MKTPTTETGPNERPGRPGKRYLGIDLPTEMYREIAQIADADFRKVADQVRLMLHDWLSWRKKRLADEAAVRDRAKTEKEKTK